ncbi:hypothetical protein E8E14_011095 [Neopestalotiopsis sp. 37M]|nr:hypothetical protein E8E14_011095 [Neopestalotiopsis sp. 37M]
MDSPQDIIVEKSMSLKGRLRAIRENIFRHHKWLLRAVGLKFLAVTRHDPEEPKVLIIRSYRTILYKSSVHLLPAMITCLLFLINVRGRYIGKELEEPEGPDDVKSSFLQIAAKMQEMLVISSLASIILHTVRRKLLYKEGVPLGLLGSHMSFSELSYFWSPDLWASIWAYDHKRQRKNFCFFGLLFVSGFIAALAGPATAILMIPRTQDWDAGGMIFWMNGSDAQLWPDRLDAEYSRFYDCSTNTSRLNDYHCPSSMFHSLWFHLSTWWTFPDATYQVTLQSDHIRKVVYILSSLGDKDTWSYTTHAASANLQDASVWLYVRALNFLRAEAAGKPPYPERLYLAQTKSFELETQVPAVRVACTMSPDVHLGHTDLILPFPILSQFETFRPQSMTTEINVTTAVYNDLKGRGLITSNGIGFPLLPEVSGYVGVPLNVDAGDASSLGMVLLEKNTTDTTGALTPLTCTIDARWAKGRSIIRDDLTGQMIMSHDFINDLARNLISTELANDDYTSTTYDDFCPDPKDASSWRHISISPEWFKLMSPSMPDSQISILGSSANGSAANRTLLERLLHFTPGQTPDQTFIRVRSAELITAMMFADGLSHVGSYLQRIPSWLFPTWQEVDAFPPNSPVRNGPPNETFKIPDALTGLPSHRMIMSAKFTGWTMSLTNWFDWFSAALLLLHALIALIHTLRCLKQHETSEAWDTIPELLALAKQSPPQSNILKNTSVGIRATSTMRRVAIIELSGISQHGDKEGLELNFRETWPEKRPARKPMPDEVY